MASRGKTLEKKLKKVNLEYRLEGKALITYREPSVKLFKDKGVLIKSFVDFEGLISNGKYIAIEAKETANPKRFPFSSISDHQFKYLTLVDSLGGLAFIAIYPYQVLKDEIFLVPIKVLIEHKQKGNKSIIFTEIEKFKVSISNYLEKFMVLTYTKVRDVEDIPTHDLQSDAAGIDLFAAETTTIGPKSIEFVPTGIALEIPKNHFGLLKLRSGFSSRNKLHITAGVIDSDYRGEIKAILINEDNLPITIEKNTKFLQIIILPYLKVTPTLVSKLEETKRNERGFGSTD